MKEFKITDKKIKEELMEYIKDSKTFEKEMERLHAKLQILGGRRKLICSDLEEKYLSDLNSIGVRISKKDAYKWEERKGEIYIKKTKPLNVLKNQNQIVENEENKEPIPSYVG